MINEILGEIMMIGSKEKISLQRENILRHRESF